MPSTTAQSVLFFRVYREAALPLYDALVSDLCSSPHLPFQLATTLEDIGQAFIGFANAVNGELKRRGVLDQEVEPDQTIEAQIDALLARLVDGDSAVQAGLIGRVFPALKEEAVRRALKVALVTQHDLPIAAG
ncbi:hypothetical protein QO001_002176 [Methylobacterium brachiatum]|uniref:Uncharacterized protein n=1 Tax=Methylobacterium brachiatum TaxID=269660 RepID=A0AAJ1WW09_9HYPH|nr:hypothetical protein [Methylobacterium brachiatum]MCB4802624.1 hypothetical protein [Methylobacterium brachiatum]MDQ0543250.1 hypothetical protein [Methylobacterium brachiatum]